MNKKWTIGILVVAVLGVLAYLGTNTDLFKGALGGGEKGGLPAVTKARCEMLIQKLNTQGLISPEWKYYDSCQYNYPTMFANVNFGTCIDLKKAFDAGNLSKDSTNLEKAHMCAKDYPAIWYGFASPQSCKTIQKWLNENKITSGAYFDEKLECAKKYPALYNW